MRKHRWLVTGAAGFIGSHLLQRLLELGQEVVGLDNFSTGSRANLDEVQKLVSGEAWARFRHIDGDIRDVETCQRACEGVDYVLHQAALGSVPRSIEDPIATHANNLTGFLHIIMAARDAGVGRFVYAASSSTYGDDPTIPKVEDRIGKPLSPYAVTKYVNELYANVFHRIYGLEVIGLRYFNVFGPRQDPEGPYAAVVPGWINSLLAGRSCRINGDGETTRDFSYIENIIQANLLAVTAPGDPAIIGQVYNVGCGERTTLNRLYRLVWKAVADKEPSLTESTPDYHDFRPGDVRHSSADIAKIRAALGYEPKILVEEGLRLTVDWYLRDHPT